MILPLPLHLAIHLYLAVLSGYLAGKYFKNIPLGIIAGVMGGFFIDLDHVLEYLLVYNWHFNIIYFFQGRQFLSSDQIHLWFHAWEYIPFLLIFAYLFRKNNRIKIALLVIALSASVHLLTDSVINKVPPTFYTLTYRSGLDFSMKKLTSPEDYQKNQELKLELGM
ncbi:MAG: hypothetical protein ACOYL8_04220 [Patescibacteria group bacterium]